MKDPLEKILENMDPEDITQFLVNMNRFRLNSLNHIKKYNKIRKLHGEVVDSMVNYIESNKWNKEKYDTIIDDELDKINEDIELRLTWDNDDDVSILFELAAYKNHKDIPSLTEIYIEKKKFKNYEKLKMLEAMKNSYASLFKVVDVDRENGYVICQDVFSNRKFKVVDVSLSSSHRIDKKKALYTYNRIITYDDISFMTGIHCMMTSDCEELEKFIKKYNRRKYSDYTRCLFIYDIYKRDGQVKTRYNHRY